MRYLERCKAVIPIEEYRAVGYGWQCRHNVKTKLFGVGLCESHAMMIAVGGEVTVDAKTKQC